MREVIISEREEGQRLDRYLEKYMPDAPKSFFYKMMRKKNIVLNGKKVSGSERIQTGDQIKLFLADETIEGFRSGKKAQEVDLGAQQMPQAKRLERVHDRCHRQRGRLMVHDRCHRQRGWKRVHVKEK